MMKFAFNNSKPRKLMFYNCQIVKPNDRITIYTNKKSILTPKKLQIVKRFTGFIKREKLI